MNKALLAALLVVLPLACSPVYQLKAPAAFARFTTGDTNRWITADGVRMRVREVDNDPKAKLPFWKEALGGHLKKRGYKPKGSQDFQTASQLPASTLTFLLPRGNGDWVMSVTLLVAGDRIIVVEVVGLWQRWKPHEAALHQAIVAFSPSE
ncbi:MAG: hypothetical protein KC502_03270 [Myxococcales bacterium]|nr:hypothetical protein [Myxococcales bacterium]